MMIVLYIEQLEQQKANLEEEVKQVRGAYDMLRKEMDEMAEIIVKLSAQLDYYMMHSTDALN